MTKPGMWLVRGTIALVTLMLCCPVIADEPYSADGRHPVRSLLEMRRESVMIQNWDLSCGAAALAILLRYEFGEPVTEKEIARGLMRRSEYVAHPELLQVREGFSLLDLKPYVESYGVQQAVAYCCERKSRFARMPADCHRRPHVKLPGVRSARLMPLYASQASTRVRVWASWA